MALPKAGWALLEGWGEGRGGAMQGTGLCVEWRKALGLVVMVAPLNVFCASKQSMQNGESSEFYIMCVFP